MSLSFGSMRESVLTVGLLVTRSGTRTTELLRLVPPERKGKEEKPRNDEMRWINQIFKCFKERHIPGIHCGTKPGHFETSKIHFPTSEGVSEVSERANE